MMASNLDRTDSIKTHVARPTHGTRGTGSNLFQHFQVGQIDHIRRPVVADGRTGLALKTTAADVTKEMLRRRSLVDLQLALAFQALGQHLERAFYRMHQSDSETHA